MAGVSIFHQARTPAAQKRQFHQKKIGSDVSQFENRRIMLYMAPLKLSTPYSIIVCIENYTKQRLAPHLIYPSVYAQIFCLSECKVNKARTKKTHTAENVSMCLCELIEY